MAEVTNAIWVRWLRGLIIAPEADGLLSDFLALPLTIVPSRSLLPEALRLSARYRISVYDSLFVASIAADSISGVTAAEPLVHAVKRDFPQIQLLRNWAPSGP